MFEKDRYRLWTPNAIELKKDRQKITAPRLAYVQAVVSLANGTSRSTENDIPRGRMKCFEMCRVSMEKFGQRSWGNY